MTQEADVRSSLAPQLPYALGRFTLCKEVGAGGMATVYLSKMRLGAGLDRLVALKTIHSHLANQQTFVDMFLDEARIASQITHPNVCAVYDFGAEDDVYYLAMEYLTGEPLFDVINEVVKKRTDDLMEVLPYLAARILANACEGLHAAHELKGPDGTRQSVVHRDVSPQNLFITYDGAVKVVDFGCAKALERVTQTNTGVMKGKVSYAAPEQLRAEDVDARSDVFALGICLWETLTLRQLFRRETAIKTAMAVLEDPIPRADEAASWVPEELADIAAKALQREADHRYQSAREMGRALRGFIAKTGVPFEAAELAEWMRHLFEERHSLEMEAVAEAEAMDTSQIAEVPKIIPQKAPRGDESTGSRAPSLALADDPTEIASATKQKAPRLEEGDEPVRLPTSTRKWILVLLLLAGAGAGVYAMWGDQIRAALASEEEPEPEVEPETQPEMVIETETVPEPDPEPVVEDETMAASEMSTMRRRDRESMRRRDRDADDETPTPEETMERDFTRGSVHLSARGGWALVELADGTSLGRTPVRTQLDVGPHELRVLPFGNAPGQSVTVQVEAGTLQRLTVHVDPEDDPARMQEEPTMEPDSQMDDGTFPNPY